jgi:DNA-binding beta-propeller fold protein YncE
VVRASDGHLVANVAVEAGPTSVRVSVDGQYVYVTNGVGNSVSVIGY